MLDFFLLPGNLPFSVALPVMAVIGAAELVGPGAGPVDPDVHAMNSMGRAATPA